MHKNETFMKNLMSGYAFSEDELLLLIIEAEEKGPQYLAALKEQIQRLDEE